MEHLLLSALPQADLATIQLWLDLAGTFIFGLSGGTLAVRRDLDLFGVIVLSVAAATAGGVMRDVSLGDHPVAVLADYRYLLAATLSGLVVFVAHRQVEMLNKPVMLFDALGLGMFTVSGCQKAFLYDLSAPSACVIAVITAVGGGVVRDLLVTEIPRVLREEIYAVAALLGAIIVVVGQHFHLPTVPTTFVAILAVFVSRVASVYLNLRAPRAK